MKSTVYLGGPIRTAIGSFGGAFQSIPAAALGSQAVKAALHASKLPPDQVDEVIFGNVVGAGLGQNLARQISLGAGLGASIGATTVNKVCGSGLKAVMLAAQAIQCGDASAVVAGGAENMSRAPYLLDKARTGYRMGNGTLLDALIQDGLWDVYSNVHMGTFGDRCAEKFGFSRSDQDDFAVASFQRAQHAMAKGIFSAEIEPVEVQSGKQTTIVLEDESPGKFNEEKLRKLRPAFGEKGTITAANASSINDGAAALVVYSQAAAERAGLKPVAKILGYSTYSREPEWFTAAPVGAIRRLLDSLKLSVSDVDLFEINEAFSVVPMVAMKELGIPHAKVNVHGGAVALGHPIGASGARTLVTLLNALKIHDAKIGINCLCIGGGESVALAVERC